MSYSRLILLALAGLFIFGQTGHAQTINWTGDSSTDWNTFSNWDAGVVPRSGNDVVLDTNSGNQAVLSSGNETIGNLTVGNLNGGMDTSLSITDGANLTATSLTIGAQAGSNGTVIISDVNSTLVVSNLTVGTGKPASGGGRRGGTSTPSTLSNGTLLIGSGVSVIASGNLDIGTNGTITQVGGLVECTGQTVIFGRPTTFPLNLAGTYNLLGGVLGSALGSNGGKLNLGGGTIQINNFCQYSGNITLVDNTTSILSLNITSPTSGYSPGPLPALPAAGFIGNIHDSGGIEVTGSGAVILQGNFSNSPLTGFVSNIIYSGSTTINGGTLMLDNGNLTASNVIVNSGGTLSGIGTVAQSVTVNSGGNIAPGVLPVLITGIPSQDSAGTGGGLSSFSGVSYESNNVRTLSIGTISLGSGTTTNLYLSDIKNYTQLSVISALTVAGNLVLNLSNPLYAGTYNLITAGSQSGDFDNVSVAGLYSGNLVENNGVWSGTFSGVNFTFTTATGIATVSVSLPPGLSANKTALLENDFNTAQLLNSAISGDLATPEQDGIPNLMKYALGIFPLDNAYNINNTAQLPQPMVSNGNLTLTFYAVQSDFIYTVEASTDLVNWSTDGVTVTMDGIQATATYPLPVNGSAFMRVVVAPAP